MTSREMLQEGSALGLMGISDVEFQKIRSLVYDRCGINLTEQKRSLVVGRLHKALRGKGFGSFEEYYNHIVSDRTGQALVEMVDRISTNYTYFNREKDHFDFLLETVLPDVASRLRKENSRDLRVWCAGCSTGEEAYMLIMLMMEYFGPDYVHWDAGLLATDISTQVLSFARNGIYPEDRLDRLPPEWKRKYFVPLDNGLWSVKDRLKKEVTFRQFNLMNKNFFFKKPFKIIFCRNVMIYFDRSTREELVRRFYDALCPAGYFFIGHSETLGREQSLFRYLKPAAYQKAAL